MEIVTLLRAGINRHKGGLVGIFILLLIVSLSLACVLSVWENSNHYVRAEMERVGFGDLTAWVSGVPDTAALAAELTALPEVEQVGVQNLIFSNYRIGGQESDSEGQLISYDPKRYSYKILTDDLSGYRENSLEIRLGEIYISPSLVTMLGAGIGDTITFPIARSGGERAFTVKGFFEDPFMGSSMIGMKGFLICEQDYAALKGIAEDAGIDALARPGSMLHIFGVDEAAASITEISTKLTQSTKLPAFLEFSHSFSSIQGFMLILGNAFTGFLLAFVLTLLVVSVVVLGHSIGSAIEQDTRNIGILKAMGFTSRKLRHIQQAQYLLPILCGILFGLLGAPPLADVVSRTTLITTGLLFPTELPLLPCILSFAVILILLIGFISLKTSRISRIFPLRAIQGEAVGKAARSSSPLHQKGLPLWLALRQLQSGKKQYISVCLVALLLVFFVSLMGRMSAWLGPDGKGMMDAFNPADLDIAIQPIGEVSMEEIEAVVTELSAITNRYALAMPSVAVNGVDYTANVITQPERFHILEGRTSTADNEVVLTEFVAADLGVHVGETVTLFTEIGDADYIVAGIYQCANDMGANIGMSREGYARIGTLDPKLWCHHFFLSDPTVQDEVVDALDAAFGHDVHVHENSWPGLYGIISAMRALLVFMYAVVILFVFVVVVLTGSKLLLKEQKALSIYKAVGFPAGMLRVSFALRFLVVSLVGAALGIALSGVSTDPLVAVVMRLCGISNFSSHPNMESVFLPAMMVVLLFFVFSYLTAGKIKKTAFTVLVFET